MTCWSCTNYRPTTCALGLRLYPNATPKTCTIFQYEPGADEVVRQEDDETERETRP
jgi:hypothetical protein